jgi:PPOX class probable F420-dependent enzyme
VSQTPSVTIPERARDIFTGARMPIGYMSTNRPDGRMSVVPVGVVLEGDILRISSLKDRKKIRNLELDPRITVCVAHPDDPTHYIEIRGTAEIADDVDHAFINWIAKTFMGFDQYPYDPPGSERAIIVVRAEYVSVPKVHGAEG